MNINTRDRILSIATDVRYWAESYAEDNNMHRDLCGMCAIASAQLFFKLQAEGFSPVIRIWYCHKRKTDAHVFLMVEDYVLDITATQYPVFSNHLIVFMHEAEAQVHEFYNHVREYKTVRGLVEHQRGSRWPVYQTASETELE